MNERIGISEKNNVNFIYSLYNLIPLLNIWPQNVVHFLSLELVHKLDHIFDFLPLMLLHSFDPLEASTIQDSSVDENSYRFLNKSSAKNTKSRLKKGNYKESRKKAIHLSTKR